ncbi:MAG: acyl-CoA dehydrogenase, partial [Actinobacteria bacterium]|nr:acyl-CoA dehydrogenase [Actinomycetota bacterium]
MSVIEDTSISEAQVLRMAEELVRDFPPSKTSVVEFLGAQFDRGLAWVHFPVGFGGLGISPKLQKVVNECVFAAGAPNAMYRNPIGHGMCGPTVVEWGSEAQKKRYLRPLFTGEEVWCQLFSEPGSGSDFAGLSSKGEKDGDEWIANGQKVWTTLAHLSRFGLLVVRTDADAVKHAGLTAFVVDMQAPGVEIRPLRQMTGEAEFNEVYFTDVRIPEAEMLGNPGDGWRVSLTTLMNERVSIGGAIPQKGSGSISQAVAAWKALPADQKDKSTLDELMTLWIRAEVHRLTNIRANANRRMGAPGPEGSIGKMESANLNKDVYAFTIGLMGAEGMLYGSYEMIRPETAMSFDGVQKA